MITPNDADDVYVRYSLLHPARVVDMRVASVILQLEQEVRIGLMPEMTTTEAAAYLAERGYTVHSKRDGTDKPPNSTTVKQWCLNGRIEARKTNWIWLIPKEALDKLLGVVG